MAAKLEIDLTVYGQPISGIIVPVGSTVDFKLVCQDPITRDAINLNGSAVVMSVSPLDANGLPIRPPVISRQADNTDPTHGKCTVPWADGDTVPSPGQPLPIGSYGWDIWIIDGMGNRLQLLSFGTLMLAPASSLPGDPVTPLPDQPPLGGGMAWKGTWSSVVHYVINDVVTYASGGQTESYVALLSSTNVAPNSDVTKWAAMVVVAVGNLSGTTPVLVNAGAGPVSMGTDITLSLASGGVTNAMLEHSSLTVTAGTGLSGGGAVSLGGSTTLSLALPNTGTAGDYSYVTTDAQGRVTAGSLVSVNAGTGLSGGGDLSTDRTISMPAVGTAGSYSYVTTDDRGRVSAGSLVSVLTSGALTGGGDLSSTRTLSISAGGVTNAMLQNNSVTYTAGDGLQNAGTVALGASATIDLRLNASGGLSKILGVGTNELGIATAGVSNTMLANSAMTVTAGTGLSGGGAVSLGSSVTISLPSVGTAGSYSYITTDAQGRVSAGSLVSVLTSGALTGGGDLSTTRTLSISAGGVTNAMLENNTIATSTSNGVTASASTALGGTMTLSIGTTVNTNTIDTQTATGMTIGGTNAALITVKSTVADGASAVAVALDTSTAWSNATAKILSIRTNGSEKAYFTAAGALQVGGKVTNLTQATATTDAVAGGRTITAGSGLSGGGDLTADRTVSMPSTGPGAGTIGGGSTFITSITLDVQGRVTAAVAGTPSGSITGSGLAANQVVYASSSSAITSSANLTYDGTTCTLLSDGNGSLIGKLQLVSTAGSPNLGTWMTLDNTNQTSGRKWSIGSAGSGNTTPGAGSFVIGDSTAAAYRFFITSTGQYQFNPGGIIFDTSGGIKGGATLYGSSTGNGYLTADDTTGTQMVYSSRSFTVDSARCNVKGGGSISFEASTDSVSASSKGRILYNSTAQVFQSSVNGGNYGFIVADGQKVTAATNTVGTSLTISSGDGGTSSAANGSNGGVLNLNSGAGADGVGTNKNGGNGGAISLDTSAGGAATGGGAAGTGGAISIGVTHAASVAIGRSGITTTITGALTQLTGVVSLTGNAASQVSTSSGALTVDSAAALNLGTSAATSIAIGNGSITTAVTGTLQANTLDTLTATGLTIGGTNVTTITATSAVADGSSAIAVKLRTTTTLANAGAKLLSIQNNTTEKLFVDITGNASFGDGTAAVQINPPTNPTANTVGANFKLVAGASPVAVAGNTAAGGVASVQGGAGGAAAASGSGNAGAGGNARTLGGVGGASTAFGTAGIGGQGNVTAGAGGAATAGSHDGAIGGGVNLTGGAGGAGATGQVGGLGGGASLKSGAGGAANGGTQGQAGDVLIDSGAGNPGGIISIGSANATQTTITGAGADGSSAVNLILNTTTTWSNAGARLLTVKNNGTVKLGVDATGSLQVTDNGPTVGASGALFKQTWAYQYCGKSQTASTSGAVTIDPTAGEIYQLTATGNITGLTLTAGAAGQRMTLLLVQNHAATATWVSTITNCKLAGGSFTKTTSADAIDSLSFISNGTSWYQVGSLTANLS